MMCGTSWCAPLRLIPRRRTPLCLVISLEQRRKEKVSYTTLYREILWADRRPYGEELNITDAHRIAFRRLVTTATERDDNDEVAKTAQELFRGAPYELAPLAGEEIDLLLGSAAIVAQKLKEFDNSSDDAPKDCLSLLERHNKRWTLSSLENSFVRWNCTAAGRYGVASVKKVLSVLEGLPEDSDSLRAAIIRHFDKMMVTTETLALCLPYYYSGLVGSSQLARAGGSRSPRRNEPKSSSGLAKLGV